MNQHHGIPDTRLEHTQEMLRNFEAGRIHKAVAQGGEWVLLGRQAPRFRPVFSSYSSHVRSLKG